MRPTACHSSLLSPLVYVISPQGSAPAGGSLFARFTAAGLKSDGSIWLFTNGARNAIARPPLHAGEANAVKSPASIAGVGTRLVRSAGTCRRFVPW